MRTKLVAALGLAAALVLALHGFAWIVTERTPPPTGPIAAPPHDDAIDPDLPASAEVEVEPAASPSLTF